MLNHHFRDLQNSIHSAQREPDLTLFELARQRLGQIEAMVAMLPRAEARAVYRRLDALLPADWPLWMEACRYGDAGAGVGPRILH